jgi:hypothetical protein
MRVRISSYRKLDSQDYLIEVSLDNTSLSYGMVSGRKHVALGRNVSKLRKLFESSGDSGIIMVRKYAYRVVE